MPKRIPSFRAPGQAQDRREQNRQAEAGRRILEPWRRWYGMQTWRQMRFNQLAAQPLCEQCKARGDIVPASIAHHKIAHKGDRELFFDATNLASLCASCHNKMNERPVLAPAWTKAIR